MCPFVQYKDQNGSNAIFSGFAVYKIRKIYVARRQYYWVIYFPKITYHLQKSNILAKS